MSKTNFVVGDIMMKIVFTDGAGAKLESYNIPTLNTELYERIKRYYEGKYFDGLKVVDKQPILIPDENKFL